MLEYAPVSWIPSNEDFFLWILGSLFHVPSTLLLALGAVFAIAGWLSSARSAHRIVVGLGVAILHGVQTERRTWIIGPLALLIASAGVVIALVGVLKVGATIVQYGPTNDSSGNKFLPEVVYGLLTRWQGADWLWSVAGLLLMALMVFVVSALTGVGVIEGLGRLVGSLLAVVFFLSGAVALIIGLGYGAAAASRTYTAVPAALPLFAMTSALCLGGFFFIRQVNYWVTRLQGTSRRSPST